MYYIIEGLEEVAGNQYKFLSATGGDSNPSRRLSKGWYTWEAHPKPKQRMCQIKFIFYW